MLTFEEARARVLDDLPVLTVERVALDDATGRVLASDLLARSPHPPFDYSAMDGYALALEDVPDGEGAFTLAVAGESRTGGPGLARIEPGTTCRIFTGAMIPPRGSAVVMQENVTRDGATATFTRPPCDGENIRRAGEDLAPGALALRRGERLGPNQIGLLATLGYERVTVTRRPVVAILSTGDELREPADPPRDGSIVDCNGPALAAWVRACGGEVRRLPFARDDREAVRDALAAALSCADVVLSIGGVSVGDHDVVKPALADAGIALDFWKVAMRPGKPLAFGRSGSRRFLGLPGNPASALLTFALFGAPLLRAMQGDRNPLPPVHRARLARDVSHPTGRLDFVRATLRWDDSGLLAEPLTRQSSGSVASMAWADGWIQLAADAPAFAASTMVSVVRFADV